MTRIWILLAMVVATAAFADVVTDPVTGVVRGPGQRPVDGATLIIDGAVVSRTDSDGRFSFLYRSGTWEIVVQHPTHRTARHVAEIGAGESDEIVIELRPVLSVTESVTVSAIRAGDDVPVTRTDLDREEIDTLSYGQDVPQVLQYTPGATWYSDSGMGSNYSYFSLRGIQQTRINMTFDGAPLNDPAEHALYFNNFHDFANDVDSIQIQRGVGTSTVGSPAYGGSVNFASRPFADSNSGDARVVFGSYDTRRASVSYGSGVMNSGFAIEGRLSYSDTAGYRESSGSEHRTFFLNAGWEGERSSLKFVSFTGHAESQMAFLAVEPEILAVNPRYNPLTEEDRDNFDQTFAQLQYSRVLGKKTVLNASLYYNGADGYFRLWDDPFAQNEILQFGIDQYFVGSMVSATWDAGPLQASAGVHYNDFQGDHTLDASGQRIYLNTGLKQTANAFGKAEYRFGRWLVYGDLQLRWAKFTYEGAVDLGSVDWTFLDPKIGFRWMASKNASMYASLGRAQREPARLDMLAGEDDATVEHDLEAVKPESVVDFEAGVNVNTARLALQANLYAMEFTDEIALTGELSDVGLPVRRNVDDSYRRGVEVDLRWMMAPNWTLLHSANLSHNRIREWEQFYDVYDDQGNWIGSESIVHRNVQPLLTPEVTLNLGAEWTNRTARVALIGRYVGESFLDNTGNEELVAPSFANLDLQASYDFSRFWSGGKPRLTLYVNNVLDDIEQYPSGYSYQYFVEDAGGSLDLQGTPYFYPLAGRTFMAKLEFFF